MPVHFPDIVLVSEDDQLLLTLRASMNRAHPESRVHHLPADASKAWDSQLGVGTNRPVVAVLDVDSFHVSPPDRMIPKFLLLREDLGHSGPDWQNQPQAKIRFSPESPARERQVQALIEFLEICEFP